MKNGGRVVYVEVYNIIERTSSQLENMELEVGVRKSKPSCRLTVR